MVFVIAHKAFIFPMKNIINININCIKVANNTSHDLGITRICALLLTTKKPPITCSAMPRIPYVLVN
jgi:hypothetical protein